MRSMRRRKGFTGYRRTSADVLFLPPIKPAECHPSAAATIVVLDHQQRTDALHPHFAFPVAVGEGDGVVLGRHVGHDYTVAGLLPGRYEHYAFNMQFVAVAARDLNAATR